MSARSRASNKYTEKAYDRIVLVVKKGQKQTIKDHAAARGLSVNRYINNLLAGAVPGFDPVDGVPVDERPRPDRRGRPADPERPDRRSRPDGGTTPPA